MLKLKITSGPNRGATWRLDQGPVLIGREKTCTVRIPDALASRRHCEIALVDEVIYLHDLGSRNTTLVNGLPVKKCALRPGDLITVGQTGLMVLDADESSTPRQLRPGATISVSEGDTVYLSEDAARLTEESGIHSITDVLLLFRHARTFSRVAGLEELRSALKQAVVARLNPACFCLILFSGEDSRLLYQCATAEEKNALEAKFGPIVQRAMEELRGFLVSKHITEAGRRKTQAILATPIYFGEHRIGAMAVESEPASQTYDETDLHFLVALAHAAAPFFGAIEQRQRLLQEVERLRSSHQKALILVGTSEPMRQLRDMIARMAPSVHSVLIIGETGTGKELAARLIHALSSRSEGPLITVNCAAIPNDLIESELFGYERGAFTGADQRKIGLFELANGGTLFLDEVGDLSPESQARILRAIETKRFRRVGGKEEIQADFRIVAATNKDVSEEGAAAVFRRDLYHRLRGIEIRIPPLRERTGDIPELAEHFLEEARANAKHPLRGFAPETLAALSARAWPGNVRELKHCIEAAVTFSQNEIITPDDLLAPAPTTASATPEIPLTLAEIEKRHILNTLEYCNGKVVEAARMLGIGKTKLYERLTEYRAQS